MGHLKAITILYVFLHAELFYIFKSSLFLTVVMVMVEHSSTGHGFVPCIFRMLTLEKPKLETIFHIKSFKQESFIFYINLL
jgi:hypothetical protein